MGAALVYKVELSQPCAALEKVEKEAGWEWPGKVTTVVGGVGLDWSVTLFPKGCKAQPDSFTLGLKPAQPPVRDRLRASITNLCLKFAREEHWNVGDWKTCSVAADFVEEGKARMLGIGFPGLRLDPRPGDILQVQFCLSILPDDLHPAGLVPSVTLSSEEHSLVSSLMSQVPPFPGLSRG